jgi:indolepyruvate decarboxylase
VSATVIQHVLKRLHDIGVSDVFGVPGDYAFPVNDAICADPDLRWIGCSNELNAAYAAEGYARIRGAGALCTTYGVGELSALNGKDQGKEETKEKKKKGEKKEFEKKERT